MQEGADKIAIRYSHPTKFNWAEPGTVCKVIGENEESELYIQVNDNKEHAEWIRYGLALEKMLAHTATDYFFIQQIVNFWKRDANLSAVNLEELRPKYNLELNRWEYLD